MGGFRERAGGGHAGRAEDMLVDVVVIGLPADLFDEGAE
jgi:hypothetical protein